MVSRNFITQQHHFPNNRINLDLGFSGLFHGASGYTVLERNCSISVSTVVPLRPGISPSFVLSDAKDMIDILLPGPARGNGEVVCFLIVGSVTVSAANGCWWSLGSNFRRDELGSATLFRPDFCSLSRAHPWLVAGPRAVCLRDNSGALLERTG